MEIEPHESGCAVTLCHGDVPADDTRDATAEGWPRVLALLDTVLAGSP